jgi:inner membrane protein
MLGKTHALTGLLVGLALLSFIPTQPINILVGILLFTILGSLFPDIDSPTSYVGRNAKIVSFFAKHRGIFHSIFPLIIINLGFAYFKLWFFLIGFSLGYLSHLFLDMFTKKGLEIYPFKKRIKGPIITGGFFEHLFFMSQAIILLIIIFVI